MNTDKASIDTLFIFTDAATSPQVGIAVGAFVCLDLQDVDRFKEADDRQLLHELSNKVCYKKYKSNKSTWAEIKTVIHALNSIQAQSENAVLKMKIEIYTDCQSLCDLVLKRKEKLEKNDFMTRAGTIHHHAELYKELFSITNKFQIKMIKVKGHQPTSQQVLWQEKIFSVLDKLSRRKLRLMMV